MKVAIAYLTKDRVELTKQTFRSIGRVPAHIFWIDGSSSVEGEEACNEWAELGFDFHPNVRGGADAAIVYALTTMLEHSVGYDAVGLCENDVLLAPDWFERTMRLFDEGAACGLEVGAASARAYDDRILIQRDGWAIMHNLGAGHVVFTRKAAELVLANYRTGWWPDNRAIFSQLSGLDIGRWAAFRGNAQWTTADWFFDAVLAQAGLASLALTPCAAEMIGQEPSLEEQGLHLVDKEIEERRDQGAFEVFVDRTQAIREGQWTPQVITPVHRTSMNAGASLVFPHQLDAVRTGDWRLKWQQGFGPFAFRAASKATLTFSVFGPCVILASGGERPAMVKILDKSSGYEVEPGLPPIEHGITQLAVPGGVSYREIEITCGEGAVFYGIQTQEPQPTTNRKFDYSVLPPV